MSAMQSKRYADEADFMTNELLIKQANKLKK